MIAKCPCEHCGANIEFDSGSARAIITCPTCGMETALYVPPPSPAPKPAAPATPPRQQSTAPALSKIPTVVWIVAGVFVLCALCLTTFLIGKNSRNSSDQTAVAKPETVEATPKTALSQFLQNQKNKQSAVKKVAFPPPPTTGIELSAKLLENFPERVLYKQGWLDGQFYSLGGDDGFLSKESVGFWIWDKDGDLFEYCFANKAKFGDLLLNLRRGDGIRIIGEAGMLSYEGDGDITKLYFRADSIQVIK